MNYRDIFKQSPPMELNWLGWKSDTYTLQRYGWDLSVNQSLDTNRLSIAIRNKAASAYGLGDLDEFEMYDYIHPNRYEIKSRPLPSIVMHLAHNIQIHSNNFEPSLYQPIDATPRLQDISRMNLEDIILFKPHLEESKEFYFKQASIDEILELAVRKQDPTQKEIRDRILRDRSLANMKLDSKPIAQLRLVA